MKLVTQDGRTLELSRDWHVAIDGWDKTATAPAKLTVRSMKRVMRQGRSNVSGEWQEFTYAGWESDGNVDAIVGTYATNTGVREAASALRAAWQSDATEFIVPQDTFAASASEQIDDLAEEYGLTLVGINELGYKPEDTARNRRIWRTTDEFERRNIIVADERGSYETSLAKWRALRRKSA